jgi:hypothetical protein
VFDLPHDVYDVVAHGLGQPSLSQEIIEKLDENFPSILSNWEQSRTVHTCIHAELRIMLHLSSMSPVESSTVRPIGVSKRSCLCCALWMQLYNRIFRTNWMTSGSHGRPYATWALPGAACSNAVGDNGISFVDKDVLEGVFIQLQDFLEWLFPGQRRVSDELRSSGDSSDSGQEASDWHRKVVATSQ